MTGGVWRVFRYDFERPGRDLSDLLGCSRDLASWASESGVRHGQRFLIGPDGFPDLRVNAFLGSARMRNLSEATNRDYV
jgi:hypothetical protein